MKSTWYDTCLERRSVREYTDEMSKETLTKILDYVGNVKTSEGSEEKWMGDLSMLKFEHFQFDYPNTITGTKETLVMIGPKKHTPEMLMKGGFLFQKIVLFCHTQGIDTCWIGGRWLTGPVEEYYRKSESKRFDPENEQVFCITPIGISKDRTDERPPGMIARFLGRIGTPPGKFRLGTHRLFFEDDFDNVLDMGSLSEDYQKVLEAFRWSPSACNRQKWKIIKEKGKLTFHFLTNPTSRFYTPIDIGIAISNFKVVAKELGLKGSFSKTEVDVKNFKELKKTGSKGQRVLQWIYELCMGGAESWLTPNKLTGNPTTYFLTWTGEDAA